MKTAVIGSRGFKDYNRVCQVLSGFSISAIISGGAHGADTLAARYAHEHALPLSVFLPDYRSFGRSAPLVRNGSIIASAQQVVAFWDGHSTGTAHTISLARRQQIPVHVCPI
jgi:predicted Rossmann fold nucleotide-binding protein DprA/Smf involved in DNA uptake